MMENKKKIDIELEVYGKENATLFLEGLTKRDVQILKKIEKILKKLLHK